MTAYFEEQIRLLHNVLAETTEKLDDVRQRTAKAHGELKECTKETKQRVDLLMENEEVIDVLLELGQLLEKEHILKEQLSGPSEDRRLWKELQDRNETITNKAQSLTCKVVEVTCQLDEAVAHFKSAKALEPKHVSKPKRNQTKPK